MFRDFLRNYSCGNCKRATLWLHFGGFFLICAYLLMHWWSEMGKAVWRSFSENQFHSVFLMGVRVRQLPICRLPAGRLAVSSPSTLPATCVPHRPSLPKWNENPPREDSASIPPAEHRPPPTQAVGRPPPARQPQASPIPSLNTETPRPDADLPKSVLVVCAFKPEQVQHWCAICFFAFCFL